MKFLSKIILKIIGWETDQNIPQVNKCVMIAAPHTSNFDFFIGLLYYNSLGIKINFLIKKEWFFPPIGFFLRKLGGIPVDRSSGNRMVEQIANIFKKSEFLHLTITPEGTRKKVSNWKKGFLYIARRAEVPIFVGYLDYKLKKVGFITEFFPSENPDSDLKTIKSLYKNFTPKHPERFSIDD